MADSISLSVKKSKLHKNLQDIKIIEKIIKGASIEAVRQGQIVALKEIRKLTPKVSNRTRLSWKIGPIREIKRFTVRGNVSSSSAGANVLERGAKFTNFPPRNKIEDWIMQKGVTPKDPNIDITTKRGLRQLGFLIGRKMKNDGIQPPRRITTKANVAIQSKLKKISKKLGIDISSRLAGKKR